MLTLLLSLVVDMMRACTFKGSVVVDPYMIHFSLGRYDLPNIKI